jgi:hypothetical protein
LFQPRRKIILPTREQGLVCIVLCQYLTTFYRSVELLRFDERDGTIFIFAGEELQIQVNRNGLWRFIV